jgi:hypothetical protein
MILRSEFILHFPCRVKIVILTTLHDAFNDTMKAGVWSPVGTTAQANHFLFFIHILYLLKYQIVL